MPTVFILDQIAASVDNSGLKGAVERLSAPDISFQTIIAIPTRKLDYNELTRVGGSLVWLDGKIPNVKIGGVLPTEADPTNTVATSPGYHSQRLY